MTHEREMTAARLPRVRAELRLEIARSGLLRAFETGGWRWRFPRGEARFEAVSVNTGGGMAGGDVVAVGVLARTGARGLVASQSQEKVYRADGLASRLDVRLDVEAGASLLWAPQETLLFDGGRLERRLEADVAADASLTLIEGLAFGRLAHGEVRIDAALADTWRVRRAGRLVFAENLKIENAGATLDRPAVGAGARAAATILRVAPDAPAFLEPLRAALAAEEEQGGLEAGASLVEGVLVARLVSPSPQRLRAALFACFVALEGREPPRVWR